MRFVKFDSPDRREVFVNPSLVTYVMAANNTQHATLRFARDSRLLVKGTPVEVAKKLEEAFDTNDNDS